MSTHLQLNPILPVVIPGKGKGYAFMVIDYGEEHHLMWVVAMDETGEIWTVANPDVRVQNNWTLGRNVKSPPVSLTDPPRAPAPTKIPGG